MGNFPFPPCFLGPTFFGRNYQGSKCVLAVGCVSSSRQSYLPLYTILDIHLTSIVSGGQCNGSFNCIGVWCKINGWNIWRIVQFTSTLSIINYYYTFFITSPKRHLFSHWYLVDRDNCYELSLVPGTSLFFF